MPEDIDNNIEILKGSLDYTNDDRQLLADFSRQAYETQGMKEMRTV